jgi:hypothetical protein
LRKIVQRDVAPSPHNPGLCTIVIALHEGQQPLDVTGAKWDLDPLYRSDENGLGFLEIHRGYGPTVAKTLPTGSGWTCALSLRIKKRIVVPSHKQVVLLCR